MRMARCIGVIMRWGLDFLHECFIGKRLKLDLLSQGPLWEVTCPLTLQPACLTHFQKSSLALHTFRSVMGVKKT